MPTSIFCGTPFALSDHWARLSVSDAQAGPWATTPGRAGVTAVSGMPIQPNQAGHDLTVTRFRHAAVLTFTA
jgi:hypothetical protein